jgi:molybdenum cofactor cytidylyltransferase
LKFGSIALSQAQGAYLAHAVQAGQLRLKKGTLLGAVEIDLLKSADVSEVIVARLEAGDLGEDQAAERLASAAAHPSLRLASAATGRVNIHAQHDGLFVVDKRAVDQINRIDPSITVATLAEFAPVVRGQMVATAKIIPFAVPDVEIAQAESIAASLKTPLFHVAGWRPRRTGLVATTLPSLRSDVMDKTARILAARLARSGSTFDQELRVAHHEQAVADAIKRLKSSGMELIVVFGASAVVDPHDVIPEGIRLSGGSVTQVGMPVDPGNLLVLGELGSVPVIGAPGCARSPKENGFDWILDRVLCDIEVTPDHFALMGVGGLLMEIETRPRPREAVPPKRQPRLCALLLAAGRSTRMGGAHKLAAEFDGQALIVRAAAALKSCGFRPPLVVLGHEAERMKVLLAGSGVETLYNPDFVDGLSSSLRTGIAALPPECDGVVVHLADMPGVTADNIKLMADAFAKSGGTVIVRATHGGKRGNPVILPRSVFTQVSRLTGDMGARAVVEGFAGTVIDVEIGSAASMDVDTPEALMAAGGLLSG